MVHIPLKGGGKTPCTAQERTLWISEETWRLVDQRTALRLNLPVYQRCLHTATRRIKASLQEYRKKLVSMMEETVRALFSTDHISEAWVIIHRW